jgi:pimeloyl-ACP methyl ester carboxylesterase
MSPTVFDTTWCQQNPAWVRLWQRTATKSGYWSTSLDVLIKQQLIKISDCEIGESQRVATWYHEMQQLTQDYTSYNLDSWTAPRTWWLDRINWPLLHDNHGFDTDALAGVPVLFTRGQYDVDVPQDWFDRAARYFNIADIETYTIPNTTHFALWEHGYQAAVDRVGKFLLS